MVYSAYLPFEAYPRKAFFIFQSLINSKVFHTQIFLRESSAISKNALGHRTPCIILAISFEFPVRASLSNALSRLSTKPPLHFQPHPISLFYFFSYDSNHNS